MRNHQSSPATELHAFCPTCPAPPDVTALLAKMGFRLAFQMEEQDDLKAVVHLPALPAQYHYKDPCGTEVIYLAGHDTPLEGEVLLFHASRFWLYAGANAQAFQLARSLLALSFQFAWIDPSEQEQAIQKEVA